MSDEISAGARRQATASPSLPWEAAAASLCAALLVLAGYHLLIDWTRSWDFNAVRLQRSFVLAAGVPLYPGETSGPILLALYGPVGALAYLPATVMRTPAAAVLAGQVLSLLFVFLPAAVLFRGRLAVFGYLLFAALIVDLRPLEYVAFSIHVDAPALALGLLAWVALLRARPPDEVRWLAAASFFAALAVWTKLMFLPLLAALPAWAWLTGGRRRALRQAAIQVAVLGLVSVALVLAFGPLDHLVFNTWTLPSLQTADTVAAEELLRGTWRLFAENATAWALWAAILLLRMVRAGRRGTDWTREPACAYGFLAIALAPFSVAGLLKVGGDVNALSYTSYFVLIGAALSWVEEARRSTFARRLLTVTPLAVMAAVLAIQEPDFFTTWRLPLDTSELPHQVAYEYALAHPGEMYFPRITLASYLAEDRVYHQSVGLLDRQLVGRSPAEEHLRAHLPDNLQGIALAENGFMLDVEAVGLPAIRLRGRDPELPGFVVYRRAPGGAATRD